MATIDKNEFGIISVNNNVINKMIVKDLISMNDLLIPCNKRGRPVKKSLILGNVELFNAVETSEYNDDVFLKIYFIAKFGESISKISNILFDKIEKDFEMLNLEKPYEITANIKGVMSKKVAPRDLKVTRHND